MKKIYVFDIQGTIINGVDIGTLDEETLGSFFALLQEDSASVELHFVSGLTHFEASDFISRIKDYLKQNNLDIKCDVHSFDDGVILADGGIDQDTTNRIDFIGKYVACEEADICFVDDSGINCDIVSSIFPEIRVINVSSSGLLENIFILKSFLKRV